MFIISLLSLSLFLSYFYFSWPTLKRQLRFIQQSDYHFEKYVTLLKSQRKTEVMWVMVGSIAMNLLVRSFMPVLQYYLVHIAAFLTLGTLHLRRPPEPPLVMNGRMIRLSAGVAILFSGFLILMGILFRRTFWWELPFVITFWGLFSDIWILLTSLMLRPFEKLISNKRFETADRYMEALAKTRASSGQAPLRLVGVAGSFGKSSFIDIAAQLLRAKFLVLSSKQDKVGSLDNAEALISDSLTAEHDLLLMEIESRHLGDVRSFCAKLPPDYGVVTGIAERNLDTFLTLDNIAATQMELVDNLRTQESLLLLNCEDELVRKQKTGDRPLLRYGIFQGSSTPSHLDIWASDLRCNPEGSTFTLHVKGSPSLACRIPLAGTFNLLHCVGAAGLALSLGMRPEEIIPALASLKPLEGSLRFLPPGELPSSIMEKPARPWDRQGADTTRRSSSLIFLDDSRQVSLEGAKDSLTVLRDCAGYRVLMTPGLRNQGSQEEEYNRRLGRQAARCCDQIIVVGKEHAAAIEDGACKVGFVSDDILLALDFKDGMRKANSLSLEVDEADGPTYLMILGRV